MRTPLSQEELASVEAVFSDLDDTLLNSTKELTPRTIRAIENLPIPFIWIPEEITMATQEGY